MKKKQLLINAIKQDLDTRAKVLPINEDYPDEFKETFDVYLDEIILKDRSMDTVSSYYYDLKTFFDFLLEKYPTITELHKLKVLHVTRYYSYLQRERNNSFLSINRKKIVINQFFSFLEQQGYLEEGSSPIPKREIVKSIKKENNKKPVFLELNEINALFESILSTKNEFIRYRNITIIALLFKTGLRVSELISLDISDIEYAREYGILVVKGKGGKERRIAMRKEDFNEGYLSYLDKYLSLLSKVDVIDEDIGALFVSSSKKMRLTSRQVQRIVRHHREVCNINKEITPHKFRHSFATHLVRSGASLRVVQQLLGHESVATTQIYTHLVDTDLIDTIDKYAPKI